MARLTFEERNKNNYTKYSDVPIKTINKYYCCPVKLK